MLQPNYRCSQAELYIAARTLATSMTENLAAITAFSPMHNAAYVTAFEGDIDAAEELPNNQTRYAGKKVGNIELTDEAKAACALWQDLKFHTGQAFSGAILQARLQEAGSSFYTKASEGQEQPLRDMLNAGSQFLTTHATILTPFLPATFTTTFNTLRDSVQAKHESVINMDETAQVATESKQKANNELNTKVKSICKMGQLCFKNDPALKRQFIFTTIIENLGNETAGIKGNLTDSLSHQPIPNATITITGQSQPKTTQTDLQGHFELNQLAAGVYTVTFQKAGYTTLTQPVTIQLHTRSTINIGLTAV